MFTGEDEATVRMGGVRVLKLRRLKRVGTSQRVDTSEDTVMDDASNQGRIIDELDKDDVVALMNDKEEDKKDEEAKVVEDDQVQVSKTVTAASTTISTAEPQVPAATITAAPARVVTFRAQAECYSSSPLEPEAKGIMWAMAYDSRPKQS
nr:hypothetical protein [Tanacetum cinerariifolium]